MCTQACCYCGGDGGGGGRSICATKYLLDLRNEYEWDCTVIVFGKGNNLMFGKFIGDCAGWVSAVILLHE